MEEKTSPKPTFFIGKVPIFGDLVLAPLDGVTDSPFRKLARRFGSAMSYTEFINAIDVIHTPPRMEERLYFNEAERPLLYQILDNDPERIVNVAQQLMKRNPDFFDINLGCSSKSVANRGAGAGLLREPQKVAKVFSLLSRTVDIPVTAKIRLGWDKASRNFIEIARIIEDNGGKAIAVHGRTRQQNYTDLADWDAIAEVKRVVKIPVIGNGDVRNLVDISSIKAHTGCDAVMIGRASIGNPWIFSKIDRSEVSTDDVLAVMTEHLKDMIDFYGISRGLVHFRKHATHYLEPYKFSRDIKRELLTCPDPGLFLTVVKESLFSLESS
jgi:tRNA-dihydrouridine synthase B